MNTPAESPARPAVTVQFPALTGDVVTTAHTLICEARGHATHTVDGVDTGRCPRCGELKAPAAVTRETHDIDAAWKFVSESYADSGHSPARRDWSDADIFAFVAEYHIQGLEAVKRAPAVKGDPSNWTESDTHTWTAECPATDDGESHYTVKATGECWSCRGYAADRAARAAANIHPRALELVEVSDYPHGARVILDPATAPTAEYGTARAVVTAYFQGGPGRGECVDAVILTVTGGDSHPARNFAALDALEALQGRVSGNITAGQYQTLTDPDSYAGTVFVYGTWSD